MFSACLATLYYGLILLFNCVVRLIRVFWIAMFYRSFPQVIYYDGGIVVVAVYASVGYRVERGES